MSDRLDPEKVVISAPMSFVGSAQRFWKITYNDNAYLRWLLLTPIALGLISFAWFIIFFWYILFGLWLVPYRLLRRSSRKSKREKLRHREVLEAVQQNRR